MVDQLLSREQFMQKYVLQKSMGKTPLDQVMKDAERAWNFTAGSSWKGIVENGGSRQSPPFN